MGCVPPAKRGNIGGVTQIKRNVDFRWWGFWTGAHKEGCG